MRRYSHGACAGSGNDCGGDPAGGSVRRFTYIGHVATDERGRIIVADTRTSDDREWAQTRMAREVDRAGIVDHPFGIPDANLR